MATSKAVATELNNVSNDGALAVEYEMPFIIEADVQGASPILFHRWSVEDVEAKANAKKGSAVKKTDNLEAYVYRNQKNELCIPGEYFRQSVVHAAKFKQDPRSPRKSAMDLFKAGITVLDDLCSLGVREWEYIDRRRVTVNRQGGVTRSRPAMTTGWKVTVTFQVLLPEYIDPKMVRETLELAGRVVGVGDMRPTYGRFGVTRFAVRDLEEEMKKSPKRAA